MTEQERQEQRINFYKIRAMPPCLCSHESIEHTCWVDADGSGKGLVYPDFRYCDTRYCECEKYKQDNLKYLESLACK